MEIKGNNKRTQLLVTLSKNFVVRFCKMSLGKTKRKVLSTRFHNILLMLLSRLLCQNYNEQNRPCTTVVQKQKCNKHDKKRDSRC